MSQTTKTSRDVFELLHAIRIKGIANSKAIHELSGVTLALAEEVLASLTADEFVNEATGRLAGFRLTPTGSAEHDRLLPEQISLTEQRAIAAAYEEFLPQNHELKNICARWQTRPDGTPNDHEDSEYDAQVIGALAAFDDCVAVTLRNSNADRLIRYSYRLTEALRRVQNGDNTAFARPLARSYHDAWMELHQEYLVSLSRERSNDDGH